MKMRDHRHEDFSQAGVFSAIHHSEDGWRQIAFGFDYHKGLPPDLPDYQNNRLSVKATVAHCRDTKMPK
ncbi:hypothetical protein [Mesorhizobium sp. M4A.F.Ca.ET.090.04.2.1]|uniref:hypothetical protein n=1 Tax=Mesorhizobium sp. M4A.F.Ca.ET.090.04.2.1 TaxID=2496663 RepID=UPI001FE1E3E6|nr:hypothetical protein [Mesorhizobium sp. M4A.F.Ca.ET.090.04.2.1]